jgi:Endosomal/lysosomal potassium channel TMEM175
VIINGADDALLQTADYSRVRASWTLAQQRFVRQFHEVAKGFGSSILRETRMRNSPDVVDGFRIRGCEVTRLESFADAIFAFALTLLIVSLEVPKSFADLIGTMRGFPAFAVLHAAGDPLEHALQI